MNSKFEDGVEDVQQALVAGRGLRGHGPYGVLIGNDQLEFMPTVIADPMPTGLQILQAVGVHEPLEHLVFQVLLTGLLEELRPDETVDLRNVGVEKFLVFRNDRSFRLGLDDQVFEWGGIRISGLTLKKLARVDAATHDVWLEVRGGGADRQIGDAELVDLSEAGVERFYTSRKSITLIVNATEYQVSETVLSFLGVVHLPFPDAVPSETRIYTVAYKRGPASNPEGTLVDGGTVQLKNRMVFNVTFTDKS